TEHVADVELAHALLEQPHDPDAAVASLVALANARGGSDNISVVVAQPVPSDVSGELSIEALHAAATTSQLRVPEASAAPAEESGPIPAIHPPAGATPAETSGELPRLEPVTEGVKSWERSDEDHQRRSSRRGLLALALFVAVAAAAGGIVWSQSYFLVERGDGRVGIDRGFPFAGLASPYRSSDIDVEELETADRRRLVDSHRLLSREDAERVLDELPEQLEPPTEEGVDGVATSS
ncbi:MAG: hypothetical protein JWM86_556, partial [Thermoleophilia bacterium]|nr:hypothetical protein [Thermoleophilia bacterium]